MRQVLLIGSVPPCTNYSGGIFLYSVASSGAMNVAGFMAVQAEALRPSPPDTPPPYPVHVVYKRNEFTSPDEGLTIEAVRQQELERRSDVPILAAAVWDFMEKISATEIWIVLEGQTLIELAHLLVTARKCPIRVQVMDPPGWQLRAANVDPDTQREILQLFDETMKAADACAAASWGMAAAYTERYAIPATAVVPALAADIAMPAKTLLDTGPRKIGFAGQPYAVDEFQALLDALRLENTESAGSPIELHAFTSWPVNAPASISHLIHHHGWTPQNQLVRMLNQMDILYCPYWFDDTYREETLLCFPSKLTTYLASGCPVLFHGRSDSSPAKFLRSRAAAFYCFRQDPASVRSALNKALFDKSLYAKTAANGRQAFADLLTNESMASAIRTVLSSSRLPPTGDLSK